MVMMSKEYENERKNISKSLVRVIHYADRCCIKNPIRQLKVSGNDAVCAAGERRRDEMDPSYPLGSATIRVL
jgi:hypothetical protein